MAVTKKGKEWERKNSLWIIWSFIIFLNAIGIIIVGVKVKVKKWISIGLLCTALMFMGIFMLDTQSNTNSLPANVGTAIILLDIVFCIVYSVHIRNEYLIRLEIMEDHKVGESEADKLRDKLSKEYSQEYGSKVSTAKFSSAKLNSKK